MPKKKGAKKRSGSNKKAPKRAAPKAAKKRSPGKVPSRTPKRPTKRSGAPKPSYRSSLKTSSKPAATKTEPTVKLEVKKPTPQKGAQNVHHFTAHLFLLCALVGFVFAITFAFTQDWLLFFLALLIMIIGLDNMALGLRKHKESMLR